MGFGGFGRGGGGRARGLDLLLSAGRLLLPLLFLLPFSFFFPSLVFFRKIEFFDFFFSGLQSEVVRGAARDGLSLSLSLLDFPRRAIEIICNPKILGEIYM